MPRRSSPDDVTTLDDLSALDTLVVDKRGPKRALAKRSRRNRHYERQFLRDAVTRPLTDDDPSAAD